MSDRDHCSRCEPAPESTWEAPYCGDPEPRCPPPKTHCCPQGPAGRDGVRGPRGPQGPEGCKGPAGRDGRDGDPGPAGTEGPQGIAGPVGPEGPQGPIGLTGPQGPQGIQGPQGETGDQGPIGLTGPQGVAGPAGTPGQNGTDGAAGQPGQNGQDGQDGAQGPAGLDALVSCEVSTEDDTCYDMVFRTSSGEKQITLQGCVSLLACGYTGDPICVTPTGIPQLSATQGDGATATFQYPIDTAAMTFSAFAGAAGSVSNIAVSLEGDYSCVEWDQTGTFNYQIFHDTTGLPVATKDTITCYPPHQPDIYAVAPATVAYDRGLGGDPAGWLSGGQADGTQSSEGYGEPDYYQNFDEYVMGGAFSGTFTVDAGQTARIKLCYRNCYVTPVAAVTTVGGNIQELCDPTGPIPTNTPVTLV